MRKNNNTRTNCGYVALSLLFLAIFYPACIYAQSGQSEHNNAVSNLPYITDTASIQRQIKEGRALGDKYEDSAEQKLTLTLQSSFRLHYRRGILKSLQELGILYHLHNHQQKSIDVLQSAVAWADTGMLGYVTRTELYTAIAYRFVFLELKDSAAHYYYKALDEIEKGKVTRVESLVKTYTQLIIFWLNMSDNPDKDNPDTAYIQTALTYLNKAEQLEKSDIKTLGKILLSKGHIHYLMHRFDTARKYYHSFLALPPWQDARSHAPYVIFTWGTISRTFLVQKQTDSAIFYANKAILKFRADGAIDSNIFINCCINLAEAYMHKKQYAKAIQSVAPLLSCLSTQTISTQSDVHEILAKAYSLLGNYQAAWQEQALYSMLKDSLTSTQNLRTISQMEMKFKVAERDKALAQKELAITNRDAKIRNQRTWMAVALSLGILFLLVALLVYRQRKHKQSIAHMQQEQERELALLEAMVDGEEKERNRLANELHDGIGGLLGTIRMQLGAALKAHHLQNENDFKDIILLLENAYDELRKTAHNLMPEILQQEGLEVATRAFCERLRRTGSLDINCEMVGSVPRFRPNIELAVYRIIQELTHNIIKHAYATEALVQLAYINGCLSVTVEDNGKGMPAAAWQSNSGMGIKTIQDRIRKMGGSFDILSDDGNGTSINLELTIH